MAKRGGRSLAVAMVMIGCSSVFGAGLVGGATTVARAAPPTGGPNGPVIYVSDNPSIEGSDLKAWWPTGWVNTLVKGETGTPYSTCWVDTPAASPDGQRVAFTYNCPHRVRKDDKIAMVTITTINQTGPGSSLTVLTNGMAGNERDPSWSPDGRRVAFSADEDGSVDIWDVAVSRSESQVPVHVVPDGPSVREWQVHHETASRYWMAEHTIATNGWAIWVFDGGWTKKTPAGVKERFPAPNPAQGLTAIETEEFGDNDIVVKNSTWDLTVTIAGSADYEWAPTWSPDFTKIAYERSVAGRSQIWAADAATGLSDVAVVTDPSANLRWPTWAPAVKCVGLPATIVGTSWADTITGTSGDDVIWSGLGNDTINGGDGKDVICGGGGNDYVDSWLGEGKVYGGAGNDELVGDSSYDVLDGGDGDDTLWGYGSADSLKGGPGFDIGYGSAGADYYKFADGISGNDQLYGGDGVDHGTWDSGDLLDNVP